MAFTLIILLSLFIIILIIFIFNPLKLSTKFTKVKIGNMTVNAEIADIPYKKMRGLMGRKNLDEREGMLFPFDEEGYHGFWMMNMSIPIDILWIGKDKKVFDIVKDAQPCGFSCKSYQPKEKAMYVLEVKANFTERHGIKIGSTVEFSLT